MRKIIAGINMTLDGICDHTAIIPDEELHFHYSDLLENAGAVLYGRKTFQLMEFWKTILESPSGNKAMDEFAIAIDKVPKIVFSHTLKNLNWKSATLAHRTPEEEARELKNQPGKNILVGSPGLIISLLNSGLVDEFQLCIHPVIAAEGLALFKEIKNRIELNLLKTKTFDSGAIILYYEPKK
jgi:dihydrofolate reductase